MDLEPIPESILWASLIFGTERFVQNLIAGCVKCTNRYGNSVDVSPWAPFIRERWLGHLHLAIDQAKMHIGEDGEEYFERHHTQAGERLHPVPRPSLLSSKCRRANN